MSSVQPVSLMAFRSMRHGSARKVSLDREFDQAYQIMDLQFAHETGAVGGNGFGTDLQ